MFRHGLDPYKGGLFHHVIAIHSGTSIPFNIFKPIALGGKAALSIL